MTPQLSNLNVDKENVTFVLLPRKQKTDNINEFLILQNLVKVCNL